MFFSTPEIISGNTTYLVWHYNDAPTSTTYPDGIFNDFAALNTLHFDLPIQTTCLPNSTPKSYGQAFAQGPCGQDLSYAEQAKTLKTLQPDLEVEKVGKGPGGTFGETIYASPNEQVVWKVTVEKNSEVMTKENLVTVSEGISLEESKRLLHKHRIEKLLVVDKKDRLVGLITIKDLKKKEEY